eukprot:CAMPEP_0172499704 /NCGR_PEP_ID=MMETSP1066-20121228/129817_1 /TAXON_ID=671091 /ORGANISM="Coscinodiscus wailesii, Strain CCMP2513" /LENGTH=292 /DNA_ID=CAMNT_0013273591 /DNA_START=106 /DNA_END=984 /DNA_ORIENTATION=+
MTKDYDQGIEFVEFSCIYPSLEPFYMEWEKDSTIMYYGHKFMTNSPYTPIIALIVYAIAIYAGQKYMADRKPFQWRKAMALWNFLLCAYSFMALSRLAPHMFHNLYNDSLRNNLCMHPENEYGRGSSGFWIQTFVWSKFAELIDTVFIIAHKKPLIFLHWYHHMTVLVYCWDAYMSGAPAAIIFMCMNCAVHFIMYGYYFLMTIKLKPRWMNAKFVTVSQITQMVVGVTTTVISGYYYATEDDEQNPCHISKPNMISAFLMYGSYLFLFLHFFVNRYLMGNKSAGFAGKKVG